MGVNKLLSVVEDAGVDTYNSNYTRKYVVVDAMSLICRFCIGYRNTGNDVLNIEGKPVSEIYACLKYSIKFLSNGIIPIFVFDGSYPDVKNITVKNRKKNSEIAKNICLITDDNKSDNYIRNFKKSYRINKENINVCKRLLTAIGIPIVTAPGEADSQCAAICYHYRDIIEGVITDDFDVLLFGAHTILKNFVPGGYRTTEFSMERVMNLMRNKYNTEVEYLAEYNKNTIFPDNFTRLNFIELCILMGTDYCPTIRGIHNFEELFSLFVSSGLNVNNMILNLKKSSKRYYIPDDFINKFENARNEYSNAVVNHPADIDISLKEMNEYTVRSIIRNIVDKKTVSSCINCIHSYYSMHKQLQKENRILSLGSYHWKHKKNIFMTKNVDIQPIKYRNTKEFDPGASSLLT
jgi:flap endonuclease-1